VDSEGEWRWRYATTRPTESRIEKRRPKDGNVDERAILDIVWKVSVTSTWVPVIEEGVLKMETMEVFVHVVDIPMGLRGLVQGSGLPGNIIQILQVGCLLIMKSICEVYMLIADCERNGGYDGYHRALSGRVCPPR